MGKGVSTFRTGQAHRLIWPLLTLACLLGFNALFTPGFYAFRTIDGHLDNHLVDILRHGSQVMILAMGMTLVIATGGVDLSVGAIMAISGAVAATASTQLSSRPISSALSAELMPVASARGHGWPMKRTPSALPISATPVRFSTVCSMAASSDTSTPARLRAPPHGPTRSGSVAPASTEALALR